MTGRRAVIGLARARSAWFGEVAQWSSSSAVAFDFLKCVSASEVRARLAGDRPVAALIVDAGAPGVGRDLIDTATLHGVAVIVVEDGRATHHGTSSDAMPHDWIALGAAAVVPPFFDRVHLTQLLDLHSLPAQRHHQATERPTLGDTGRTVPGLVEHRASTQQWLGQLVAVTGVAGTGRSTVAMALAQGLAHTGPNAGSVALADFCSRADLAMYHDVRDVVPAVQELVESHSAGDISRRQLRGAMFDIEARGYSLLLGLRRTRDWTALRPASFEAALTSLRTTFRIMVADIDNEFDGEAETASPDIERRNASSRITARSADVVAVCGDATLKGLHGIIRLQRDLLDLGIAEERIVAVVNRAPRSPRARSDIAGALNELGEVRCSIGTVFLPDRRQVEVAHGNAGPLPVSVVGAATSAIGTLLERVGRVQPASETTSDRAAQRRIDTRRAS